jgi:hypothetical protein
MKNAGLIEEKFPNGNANAVKYFIWIAWGVGN